MESVKEPTGRRDSDSLAELHPVVTDRTETLPLDMQPIDNGDQSRLLKVFAGLVALFLVSGLIWFVVTSNESNSTDFSSIPAGDDAPPQTPEQTATSVPTSSQSSKDGDDRQSTDSDDRATTEDSEALGVESPDSERTAVDSNTATNSAETSTATPTPSSPPAPLSPGLPIDSEEPPSLTTRVQIQSQTGDEVLAGVGVTLVAESTGQTSVGTSSSSGFVFLSMPVGCGTLSYEPPTGYELTSPVGSSIRVCSEESSIVQFASFKPIDATNSGSAATAITWVTSSGICDDNGKRSFEADIVHTGPSTLRARMDLLDSSTSVVGQSQVVTIQPTGQASVKLDDIPTGALTVRIVNASNSQTIAEMRQSFDPC